MKLESSKKKDIQVQLIEFLCNQFMVDEEDIELDESLIDTGIIDSMGLIEISSYIEKKYVFKISEEMMNRSNFGSVYKIVDFISAQINS